MTVYSGYRDRAAGEVFVTKDGGYLAPGPSQKVWNHSPDGFEWSYGGSGPAQLALAILLDVTGDADLAVEHHQAFKWEFVAGWKDEWQITSEQVKAWLEEKQNPKAG